MLEAVDQLRDDAAKCAGASLWALSDADLTAALDAVHGVEQTIAAVKLHLVREADARDIATGHHARSTAAWLSSRLRLDASAGRRLVSLAAAIDRHPDTDAALCTGAIHLGQAVAVVESVDTLPQSEIPPDVRARAETALLELAAEFAPSALRRLGPRILDHVAPEIAERADHAVLERFERRAYRRRGLSLSPPVAGIVHLRGALTVEDAAIVTAALDPLAFPAADGDPRTPAQLRADALVDVCRIALRSEQLPDSGGEPPQLTVTVDFDTLARQLSTGRLDSGEQLSPGTVRRLACDARIRPMVLGRGPHTVLDAGRSRRLATGPLRRALVARDRGCAHPGCDRPARWCDAHHVVSWAAGGTTRLENLVLLCRHHHREIHEGDWVVRIAPRRPARVRPAVHAR